MRPAGSDAGWSSYTLGTAIAAGADTRWVVQAFTVTDFAPGTQWEIVIRTAATAPDVPPRVTYRPGVYIATSAQALTAPRYDANVPSYAEETLANGAQAGLSVTSSNRDQVSALAGTTPAFDLAADDHRGEVEISVRMTLSGRSDTNISFAPDRLSTVRVWQERRFVDELLDLVAITAGTTGGALLDASPVYLQSTAAKLGELQYFAGASLAAADGDPRNLTMIKKWDGDAGTHSWSVSYHVEIRFFPARHYGLAGGAFTDLSDTPASLTGRGGQYVCINAAGTAIVFQAAPCGS